MYDFTGKEIARMLSELGDLMEINDDNKYRIRAYNNAARSLSGLSGDLKTLVEEEKLEEIRGIGQGIAATIREIFEKGYCVPLEELKSELPAGVLELINIPGLGPRTAHRLFYELQIQDISDLKQALKDQKVRQLKGFGPKMEANLLQSLREYEEQRGRLLLDEARAQAEKLLESLEEARGLFEQISIAGSTRRQKEVIGDLDILIATREPQKIGEYIRELEMVNRLIAGGRTKTSIITDQGLQVDFRYVEPDQFPAALQYFTGSRHHNLKLRQLAKDRGYKLNEYGLFKGEQRLQLSSEAEIYQKLGLDYIIPELREDRGELEAAARGELPGVVEIEDIRGDLHLHSQYSDGAYTIEEMARAALSRGYSYIAITDHSRSLTVAHGLTEDQLKRQGEEIDQLQEEFADLRILKGIEVDIMTDGSLDFEDRIMADLDLVIASIHTGLGQDEQEITDRIVAAINNPHVDIIGHPQGRILGRRSSYAVDLDRVLAAAADTNTCLEINSSPSRLDLDDVTARRASEAGIKMAINTDAHHIRELDHMELGIAVARRAWLTADDVVNTRSIDQLLTFCQG